MTAWRFAEKIRIRLLILFAVGLGGCIPRYAYYYAPQGEGNVPGRCGYPSTAFRIQRNDIGFGGDIRSFDDPTYFKTHPMILDISFEIPEGHTVKILSADAQAFLDDAATPIHAHVRSPWQCHELGCEAQVNDEIHGSNKLAPANGINYRPDRYVPFEVVFDNPGYVPKKIRYVLPPISFDGKEAEVITWTFLYDSTLYISPLNGC